MRNISDKQKVVYCIYYFFKHLLMKKLTKAVIAGVVGFAPLLAFAAANNIADLIIQINAVVNTVVPFIVGLAVLIIIWGVFNYVAGAGDEEKRAEAKQYIIWGIIGVVVMLSIWGLVAVLEGSFDLKKTPLPSTDLPSFGGGTVLRPTSE